MLIPICGPQRGDETVYFWWHKAATSWSDPWSRYTTVFPVLIFLLIIIWSWHVLIGEWFVCESGCSESSEMIKHHWWLHTHLQCFCLSLWNMFYIIYSSLKFTVSNTVCYLLHFSNNLSVEALNLLSSSVYGTVGLLQILLAAVVAFLQWMLVWWCLLNVLSDSNSFIKQIDIVFSSRSCNRVQYLDVVKS